MKSIGIIYLISFVLFAPVRYHTGEAFHTVGDFIQNTAK